MKIKRSLLKYRGNRCLNCDFPLDISDRYCPRCGQMNSTKKLSLEDFFEEFFSGVFAYDSRLHRTLRALIFKPGKISKDYVKGKRTRYANPFRFYLSASIIFFLIFSINSMDFLDVPESFDTNSPEAHIAKDSIKNRLAEIPELQAKGINLDSLETSIQKKAEKKTYKESYVPEKSLDTLGWFNAKGKKFNLFSEFYEETNIRTPDRALDSLHYRSTNFNRWMYRKAIDYKTVQTNPKFFANYFIGKLPFIIFFYLPVFAVFIWLLYIRRPFNYMEHLIFTFHVQTVFFVLFSIALLIDYAFNTGIGVGLASLAFLFYLYKAMRNFYEQGRVKTIVKFILLNVIFFILAIVGGILSFLASFAIY